MKSPNQTNLRGFSFRRLKSITPTLITFLLLLTMATAGAISIHEAAKAGDAVAVRSILQTNVAAASLTNSLGETPFHLAAIAGSPEVVEALLAANAPVNVQAQDGNTALHHAIAYWRMFRFAEDIGTTNIQQLGGLALKLIANPEIRRVGENAIPVDTLRLRRALTARIDPERTRVELKIIARLLAAGADVKLANLGGDTPLHGAAMRSEPEFLQMLLAKGADCCQ